MVGRRFRLLGRTAFLCLEGGETHYLSPLDLLAYAILGEPQARGLGRVGWSRLHAAAYAAGLTLESPDEPESVDLRAWTQRYSAELSSGPISAPRDHDLALAIDTNELSWLWGQRASVFARPDLRALLASWASPRGMSVEAILALEALGEVALFGAGTLPGGLPRWLPWSMRAPRQRVRASLAVPVFDLTGRRVNLCARSLELSGPKSTRATGIQARGQLYANPAARALLAGTLAPSPEVDTVIIAEGEADWLLWASQRPDLPCLGIFSGSVTSALGALLAAWTRRGWSIALRTDRDPAGDTYAARLCEVIRAAEGLPQQVFRAQPRAALPGADDGDLHQAGLLDLSRPLVDTCPIPVVDAAAQEPWTGLPEVALASLRGEAGHLERTMQAALRRAQATVLSFSTGSGKTHALVRRLSAGDPPAGVTVVAVQSRLAVVEMVARLREAGVRVARFLGRDGPHEAEQSQINEYALGTQVRGQIITCVNAKVLARSRMGLDARVSCGQCPFRSMCEQPADPDRAGTRGDILHTQQLVDAGEGVVVCTHQGLPVVLQIAEARLAAVVIDELPSEYGCHLVPGDIDDLAEHRDQLWKMAADPELLALNAPLTSLAEATEILIAVLHRELAAANVRRSERAAAGLSGADIQTLQMGAELQQAAQEWEAALEAEDLNQHPAARFPNLRREALRLLLTLAQNEGAVDVVAREGEPTALVSIAPLPIPADVPIVGLDATPVPERWELIVGRPVSIQGARVPRHANERAVALRSSYHRPAPWNERERRLARAELERLLLLSVDELETVREARTGAEPPLALLVGWKSHLEDINAVVGETLRQAGFRVRLTHWYSADFRGSNDYTGAAVVVLCGLPRANGDAQRLEARALARARDVSVEGVGEEVDWSAVTRSALAAMTQAAGRARSTVDPLQQPTLYISVAPTHPHVVRELIEAGQGTDFQEIHGNDQTLRRVLDAGLGWVSGALSRPALTPGLADHLRPSRSGLERYLGRLRVHGSESIAVQPPGRGRPVIFYRVPGTSQPLSETLRRLEATTLLETYEQMKKPEQTPTASTEPLGGSGGSWASLPHPGEMVCIEGDPAVLLQIRRQDGVPSEAWWTTIRRFVGNGWRPEDVPLGSLRGPQVAMWQPHLGLRVVVGTVSGRIAGIEDHHVLVEADISGRLLRAGAQQVRPEQAGPIPSDHLEGRPPPQELKELIAEDYSGAAELWREGWVDEF